MTEEVVEVTAEEEQAFEAAFHEARGEEPPAEVEQKEEPKEETVAEQPETQEETEEFVTDEPPEEKPDPIAELKNEVEELRRQLRDNNQKIHGKMGEAFRSLQQLQQQREAVGLEITEEDLDESLREYDGLSKGLAATLKNVLGKALGGVKPAEKPEEPKFDPSFVDQRVAEVTQAAEAKIARKNAEMLLEMQHPDWHQVSVSDEFKKWTLMQKPEVRKQILESESPAFASRALTAFKQWRTGVESTRSNKTKRLEAAVMPRGSASPTPAIQDEETAMMQEFMSRRR